MALQKQIVQIPLGGGLDTKTDAYQIDMGSLSALENAVFTNPKRLAKCFGLSPLVQTILGGGSIDSGKFTASLDDELLMGDGQALYAWSPAASKWINRGALFGATAASTGLAVDSDGKRVPNVAYGNGFLLYAWENLPATGGTTSDGLYAMVVDANTGRPVVAATLIDASGVRGKCTYSEAQGLFYLHYCIGSTIYVTTISASSPSSFTAAVTVATDIEGGGTTPPTQRYDVAVFGSGAYEKIALAYVDTSAEVVTAILAASGAFSGTMATYVANAAAAIAVTGYSNNDAVNDGVYVFYDDATSGLSCLIYDLTLSNTPTPVVLKSGALQNLGNIGAVMTSSSDCQVFFSPSSIVPDESTVWAAAITRSGGTSPWFVFAEAIAQYSKPFVYNGTVFQVLGYNDALQGAYYLVAGDTTATYVNRVGYQNSTEGGFFPSRLTNVAQTSSTDFVLPTLIKTALQSTAGGLTSLGGVNATVMSFSDRSLWQTADVPRSKYIAAGMLMHYDGKNLVEAGFSVYPEFCNVVSAGSGTLTAGTRTYAAIFEWTDNNGQIHRSAPKFSAPITSTGDANLVTVPVLNLTAKQNVKIGVYRTVDAGTTYYKVATVDNALVGGASPTYTDSTSDDDLVENELLYTTGGVVDNIPPPSCSSVVPYRNRLVLVGLEDENAAWYSKAIQPGYGVAFSDSFVIRCDEGKGGLKAGGVLDEKLILFKASDIFVTAGQGPLDTGYQNDFQTPQRIMSDVGCSDPKSVVSTTQGLIFKSAKGWYLLDRTLNVQYIGARVEAYNGLTVSGAVLMDGVTQVRFTHSDGTALMYDYALNQWATQPSRQAAGCCIWQDSFVVVTDAGVVKYEDGSTYLDSGSAQSTHFTTPWIATAGIEGFQRVYAAMLLGQKYSNHVITIKVGYDREETYFETFVFDLSTLSGTVEQLKLKPSRQQCQAIRFDISDSNASNIDGAGFAASVLALKVGIKGGLGRVPAAQVMTH